MFAIELTEDNLPKILHTDKLSVVEAQSLLDVFALRDYVFIRGYYADRHPIEPWVILPKFVFEKTFDFDPIKIKTDWDQIVRL